VVSGLSFAAPAALALALAAALGITLLHLLSRQRPPRAPFPTARFVPEGRGRATSRARRPKDIPLLVLRIAIVLLAGAAFARPVATPARRPVARVFLLDRSRAVVDARQGIGAIRALWREGDIVLSFDTLTRRVEWPPADSTMALAGRAPGSLSAALLASLRTVADLRRHADSLELVVVSPLTVEEVDRASPRLRALWPGSVRLARTAPREGKVTAWSGLDVRAPEDDPLSVAAALAGARRFETSARLVRGTLSASDSTWARDQGRVLVRWPTAGRLDSWLPRAHIDTSGAVVAGDAVVVAPFVRRWTLPHGAVVARWSDGDPAAVELPLGEGCIRDVAIGVPVSGDLVLTPAFARLLRVLTRPCAAALRSPTLGDSALDWLTRASAAAAQKSSTAAILSSPIAPWLFVTALLLALAEPFLRRARGSATKEARDAESDSPRPPEEGNVSDRVARVAP
jgi:aerotolerance regulator-like protein